MALVNVFLADTGRSNEERLVNFCEALEQLRHLKKRKYWQLVVDTFCSWGCAERSRVSRNVGNGWRVRAYQSIISHGDDDHGVQEVVPVFEWC